MSLSKSLRILSVFLLSYFIFSNAYGQTDSLSDTRKYREQFIYFGTNISPSSKSRDAAFSPLLYDGPGIGGGGGFVTRNNNFEFLIDGSFIFGLMSTKLAGSTDTGGNIYYSVPAHAHALWTVNPVFKSTPNAFLRVGGAVDFSGNFRGNFSYTNSALNFEYISGIGPGAQVGWDVHINKTGKFFRKKDRDLTFLWTVSLPLMGTYMRPSYNTISDFTTGANFISGGGQQNFAFIGNLVQFNSRLEMYYRLHNKNAFRLFYEWKYFAVNEGSSGNSKGAYHQIGIAFMFNVTGNK
ncbi:hypothetical protein [Flammeovirga aprica]|uniref:Outer membrane protein beta-barrel domain-containing protein n=1 Tax=Flammeovirga aprica JL-4 TaxID=694437 RepID=A0A7X9RTZ5_9BACT|nr:hypothetical protein [Flammeovirga aprica]NME68359.1 hypothetical protein [Flammeovirga aprica JL-4]